MSMEAIADVPYSRSTGSVRDVLVGLAFHAHRETRLAFPSNDALARWTLRMDKRNGDLRPISHRQIQRALEWLERAGEIRRIDDRSGRRMYRVDPIAGRQLTLEEEAMRHLDVAESTLNVAPPRDIQAQSGDTLAANGATSSVAVATPTRARVGTTEPTTGTNGTHDDPLKPPKGGNDQSRMSFRSSPSSSPAAQGTGRRRRRRGRRTHEESPPPPVTMVPCPLATVGAEERAALQDAWLAFVGRVRGIAGADEKNQITSVWEMFGAGAHAHEAADGLLVVGVNPRIRGWLAERLGGVLDTAAGGSAVLVACPEAKLTAGGA